MTSKKAFTLIEVLVAVMIISITVAAILRFSSKEDTIINHYKRQEQLAQESSLFVYGLKIGKDKRKIELYDFIKNLKIKNKEDFKKSIFYKSDLYKNLQGDKNGSVFKIYKENFSDKEGISLYYYRITRE